MTDKEKDIQQIADYLSDSLSATERDYIDQRLNSDTGFKQLFHETKLLITGIKVQGREKVKRQLEMLEQSLPPIEAKKSKPMWPWISGIAATMLIVTLVLRPSDKVGNSALFDQYYSPYPNIVLPVVRGEDQDSSLRALAFTAYDHQDYLTAIRSFTELQSQSEEIKFYLASSYLANDQTQQAIDTWSGISTASMYYDQTLWFLSLAYLKLDHSDKASETLKKLIARGSSYTVRATELLDKLER